MRGGGLTRVTVGQLLTFTGDEERELEQRVEHMRSLIRHKRAGWRVAFIEDATRIDACIWRAVTRAQKSPQTEERLD